MLPLPPIDDHANPDFKDAASCAQWLGQLQLTNLHQAHEVLRTQLNEFNRCAIPGLERLHTLELLRETVSSVQADYAKKLAAKRLPLSTNEYDIFVAITELWQDMTNGYQRCLQDHIAGDAQLAAFGALLCQRCLLYGGLHIFEHQRSGYEFDGRLYQQLYAIYLFSEEQGLQLVEVSDDLNARATSCTATFVKTLLACHASRAELTRQQMQILDRWLTLWSPSVTVEHHYVASTDGAPPLAVDLDSSQGLQAPGLTPPSEHMRYLAMTPLSKMLRVKIILLQQGQSPQHLDLGAGYSNAHCVALLNILHQCWCEEPIDRMAERRNAGQLAQMCYGMDGCFAYIANKPFKQPSKSSALDTLSRKQIMAFGHVLTDTEQRHDLSGLGFVRETWLLENENIFGARLLREGGAAERIGLNQLVALRPDDADIFMLGTVRWISVTRSGQLQVGVRYLPGVPQAIAMKATGINLTVSSQFVAALLLPEVPALKSPASLIIPRDWYKPDRVVEIVQADKGKFQARMGISVEKGLDYERVSFTDI